ncbi:MAG: hypothetical protein FD169_2211, partial [Bacillota bacterium]
LVEDGLTEAEAMAKVQAAIAADPSLENLDDLLEDEDSEDIEVDTDTEVEGQEEDGDTEDDEPDESTGDGGS